MKNRQKLFLLAAALLLLAGAGGFYTAEAFSRHFPKGLRQLVVVPPSPRLAALRPVEHA